MSGYFPVAYAETLDVHSDTTFHGQVQLLGTTVAMPVVVLAVDSGGLGSVGGIFYDAALSACRPGVGAHHTGGEPM